MTYLGIDPGLSGALAWISPEESKAIPMPILDGRPDLHAISGLLLSIKPDIAMIELAMVLPGQGACSGFTIGLNYGLIVGGLTERGIPLHEVRPTAWKKALGIQRQSKEETPKELKERAIALALRLFPATDFKAGPRCRNYHDGMAESMLLAHYCRLICLRGVWG